MCLSSIIYLFGHLSIIYLFIHSSFLSTCSIIYSSICLSSIYQSSIVYHLSSIYLPLDRTMFVALGGAQVSFKGFWTQWEIKTLPVMQLDRTRSDIRLPTWVLRAPAGRVSHHMEAIVKAMLVVSTCLLFDFSYRWSAEIKTFTQEPSVVSLMNQWLIWLLFLVMSCFISLLKHQAIY